MNIIPILILCLFINQAESGISTVTPTVSNNKTLVTGVTYNFKFTLTGDSITSGSTTVLMFSSNFYLTSASSCQATIGTTLSSIGCTVTSTGSGYNLTFAATLFPSTVTITSLELQVLSC